MLPETKFFEIRDRMTNIPAMATRCPTGINGIVRRGGYNEPGDHFVSLVKLADGEGHTDPYDWDHGRTLGNAHIHIHDFWDDLKSGQVIDVEFILGESSSPKEPESNF